MPCLHLAAFLLSKMQAAIFQSSRVGKNAACIFFSKKMQAAILS